MAIVNHTTMITCTERLDMSQYKGRLGSKAAQVARLLHLQSHHNLKELHRARPWLMAMPQVLLELLTRLVLL